LVRNGLFLIAILLAPMQVGSAPYAAMVIDARTGEVLHSRNADTRLHPASLTKMMTLYIAFQAVERGEISMDTMVTIPQVAANEPPSKLGLRAGQRIRFRYLVRAAAVKSANDAATAIGVTIAGSEAAFARRMTRTAQAMGMTRTTFRNAHGLTESGHLSTAHDMTELGRHMIYDYPQYYNLFSRRTTDAGVKEVTNTNRRLLANYRGADGIKTGYTRAAGFNLVASAERGQERIIATVFGGRSTATRNARVAELLDMGFSRAPTNASVRAPALPRYTGNAGDTGTTAVAESTAPATGTAGRTIRVNGAVTSSLRPKTRPITEQTVEPAEVLLVSRADILEAIEEAQTIEVAVLEPAPTQPPTVTPQARPANLLLASAAPAAQADPAQPEQEVVTRVSTSGGRHWGINVGRFPNQRAAERMLMRTALNEMSTLDGSLRRVVNRSQGYDANFMGLSRETADLACRRLQSRGTTCFMIGPS
jgi:D-alanyl-D-alanine carboxypeptidase